MAFRTWNLKEERLNATLDVLFLARYHNEYMVIFEDGALHRYIDYKLKPEQGAKTRNEVKGVCFQPQKFRPDVVMLDKTGNSHIVETKIGSALLSEKDCFNLVVQTLIYTNLILSPIFNDQMVCTSSYKVFDLLHHAHWFRHRRFEGECPSLDQAHQKHFHLSNALKEEAFGRQPSAIFLIENVSPASHKLHVSRISEACEVVHRLNWSEFKKYALKELPANSPFRERFVQEIHEQTWDVLRTTKFALMPFYPARLESVLGDHISLP